MPTNKCLLFLELKILFFNRCAAWVAALKISKLVGKSPDELYKFRVCGAHFKAEAYNHTAKKLTLRWDALPTENLAPGRLGKLHI